MLCDILESAVTEDLSNGFIDILSRNVDVVGYGGKFEMFFVVLPCLVCLANSCDLCFH